MAMHFTEKEGLAYSKQRIRATDVSSHEKWDAFKNIAGTSEELSRIIHEAFKDCNKDQILLVSGLRVAPLGHVMVEAAAQSEKISFINKLAQALTNNINFNGSFSQVLVVVTQNSAASEYARAIAREGVRIGSTMRPQGSPGHVVIRLHSRRSEEITAKYPAPKPHRPMPEDQPIPFFENLLLLENARTFWKMHEEAQAQNLEIADDSMVQLQELGLGNWMLRRLGLDRYKDDPWSRPNLHRSLLSQYHQWSKGRYMESDQKQQFIRQLAALRKDVLKVSNVTVTTISPALRRDVQESLDPTAVIVDEAYDADSTSEEHYNALQSCYAKSARTFMLVGGFEQKEPFLSSAQERAKLIRTPLQTRYLQAKVPLFRLPIQQCAQTDMVQLYADIFYGGEMARGLAEAVDSIKAIKVRETFKRVWNVSNSSMIVFNVSGACLMGLEDRPKPCEEECAAKMGLLEVLADSGFEPEDIGSLTFYDNQRKLEDRASAKLAEFRNDANWKIKTRTVDLITAEQFNVSVLTVAAGSAQRFSFDQELILKAITRGRDGLIIVANLTELGKAYRFGKTPLGKVLYQLQDSGLVVKWAQPIPAHYLDIMPSVINRKKQLAEMREMNSMSTLECRNCRQLGHSARNCQNPKVHFCLNCHMTGHEKMSCPMLACAKCHQVGHRRRDCPRNSVPRCKDCGGEHLEADCVQNVEEKTKGETEED